MSRKAKRKARKKRAAAAKKAEAEALAKAAPANVGDAGQVAVGRMDRGLTLRRQDDAVVLDKAIQQAQHLREEVRGALGVEA